MKASERPEVQRYGKHVNPHLISLLGVLGYGRFFTRAKGERLEDHQGRSYLDALGGFGSVAAGHHEGRLRRCFEAALEREEWGAGEGAPARALRERLGALSGLEAAVFATSGAEAIDAAIKLARAATGRSAVLGCQGSYHGLNLGSLSLAGERRPRAPFEPLLPGCYLVPHGDIAALDRALSEVDAAAFVVEPVQIEGGLRMPPPGYLADAKERCARRGTLLVFDEIQSGLGRCGEMFSWRGGGERPDIVTLGKALGGSYCALSAALTTPEILERAAGAPVAPAVAGVNVASAVALEVLDQLEGGLIEASRQRGAQLLDELRRGLAGHRLVKQVRGRGLLVGVELDGPWQERLPLGHWFSLLLLERGVVCQPTTYQLNTLRLTPPLSISAADVSTLADRVVGALGEHKNLASALLAMAARASRQAAAGYPFG